MLDPRKATQLLWSALLAALLLVSGCSTRPDRSAKASNDWSRGLWLGKTRSKHPIALQVDAQKHVHMAWCEIAADGGDALHYARLNQQGQVLVNASAPLSSDLPYPRRPQLLIDEQGTLHLAFLSRAGGRQRLYHAALAQTDQPALPLLLSGEQEDVDSFQMYRSAEGESAFLWSGHPEPEGGPVGVFHRGPHDSASTLLIAGGSDPCVLVDASGTTHLAWLHERGTLAVRDVHYATLDGSRVVPEGGQKLADFRFAESGTYHGPVIGADTSHVYVIWAVQSLGGGFTPSAADAFYVSFPPGRPALTNPRALGLPPYSVLEYTTHLSPYGYHELVHLTPGDPGTDFLNAPSTVRSQESELPVALSVMVQSTGTVRRASQAPELQFEDTVALTSSGMELALVVLSEGEPVGYQLVTNTPGASVLSTLVADADADLHMAWIDTAGFRQYDVYYATTAPEARRWLDRTTAHDVLLGAAGVVWGILSGVALIPILAIWNLGPVMWVVVFYVFSGREHLEELSARIGLLVAILIYSVAKLLFLPGLSTGAPLLPRLPVAIASLLAVVRPLSILVLALAVTYLYARRSDEATMFKAYLVFALTDGLLTALLYAPQFFRAA